MLAKAVQELKYLGNKFYFKKMFLGNKRNYLEKPDKSIGPIKLIA